MVTDSIGANTNAPAELVSADCVLFIGEDPASSEAVVAERFGVVQREHRFRGYVFQLRDGVTTIFSGMGTGCTEALVWELNVAGRARRLVLAGTAGLMPRARVQVGRAYVVDPARAAGSGIESLQAEPLRPRWCFPADVELASMVSTDFFYGFCERSLAAGHPYFGTRIAQLFVEAREDMVDMESAAFYAICQLVLPGDVQYVSVKSPANPAGESQEAQLQNAPVALACCCELAARLLKGKP